MVFGRLLDGLLPRRSVRLLGVVAAFTITSHLVFNLSLERSFSAAAGIAAAALGVSSGESLFFLASTWLLALAAGNPMLLVIVAASAGFFLVDPLSQRGGFLDDFGFAIKIVIVTVLAYVSALVIGPPIVDFVLSGGGLGG